MVRMTTHPTQRDLRRLARALAGRLGKHALRIVFAESCTGGLVSAALAQVPGVSQHHCGSAVAYRAETKAEWLGVPREPLHDPGPVSEVVAQAMATGVLSRTPEADLGVSITGHLGPGAPAGLDGLACVAIATRSPAGVPGVFGTHWVRLEERSAARTGGTLRQRRQTQAAAHVLSLAVEAVESLSAERSARS
jgi:nicotinamide-nucleotide amidase